MHAIPPGYSPVWVLSGLPRDSTRFGFCLGVFSFLGFHFYIAACILAPTCWLQYHFGRDLLQEKFIYRGVIGGSKILVGVSATLVEIARRRGPRRPPSVAHRSYLKWSKK
ncbi:hypothetical protein PVAP13_1NG305719 [Panicum virgatum]|uniref:Uncharacterized protein n=1 Tax=Panicum virgatum TaxID=38727 RepID=A0A8T0WV26_PANVG|nr:hypothetical protein PVAP13_1NG305719 [Panicum virgatum]